jgi:parallel beta-helix repeat protein
MLHCGSTEQDNDGSHTVRDLTITGSNSGIQAFVTGNKIHRNSIEGSSNVGILISGQQNRVIGNHVDTSRLGISITPLGSFTKVIANVVTGARGGIVVGEVGGEEIEIRANDVSGNRDGIRLLEGAQSNSITGNRAKGNTMQEFRSILDGNGWSWSSS